MKNNRTLIVLLIALLVMAVAYILIDLYGEAQEEERLSTYQSGLQAGYERAVLTVIQQAAACQQVPLFVGNQSINLIAVECLQQR